MNATDILNKISKLYNECNYYSDTGKIQFYSSSSSCLEVRSPVSFKTQYHKPYQFSLIWSQDGCTDSISSDGKSVFKKDFDMNEPERIDAKGRIERKISKIISVTTGTSYLLSHIILCLLMPEVSGLNVSRFEKPIILGREKINGFDCINLEVDSDIQLSIREDTSTIVAINHSLGEEISKILFDVVEMN